MRAETKRVYGWALYDWANSAYATTVMAGLFPLFFKAYYSADADVTVSTAQLGLANALSSIVVVLMAPLLGAIADAGGIRRRFTCWAISVLWVRISFMTPFCPR